MLFALRVSFLSAFICSTARKRDGETMLAAAAAPEQSDGIMQQGRRGKTTVAVCVHAHENEKDIDSARAGGRDELLEVGLLRRQYQRQSAGGRRRRRLRPDRCRIGLRAIGTDSTAPPGGAGAGGAVAEFGLFVSQVEGCARALSLCLAAASPAAKGKKKQLRKS